MSPFSNTSLVEEQHEEEDNKMQLITTATTISMSAARAPNGIPTTSTFSPTNTDLSLSTSNTVSTEHGHIAVSRDPVSATAAIQNQPTISSCLAMSGAEDPNGKEDFLALAYELGLCENDPDPLNGFW